MAWYVAAVCFYLLHQMNMAGAARALRRRMNKHGIEPPANTPRFITQAVNRFLSTGSVHKIRPPGRAPKLGRKEAMECAEALLGGYTEYHHDRNNRLVVTHNKPYDSIPMACMHNATLQAYMAKYKYNSPYALYRRIIKVYPEVVRKHPLDCKLHFSATQMAMRVEKVQKIQQLIAPDHTLLNRVVWMDAWHVKLNPKNGHHYAVYIAADDQHQMHAVVEVPYALTRGKYIHINVLAAVSADLGPVYWEYVSGTSEEVGRMHDEDLDPGPYYVSHDQPCSSTCICAPSSCCMCMP